MRRILLLATAALAACAEGEQVTDAPEDIEVNIGGPTGPVSTTLQSNAAPTNETASAGEIVPGQWFTRMRVGNPWAGYGPPDSEAAFAAHCAGEQLVFSTTAMPSSGAGPTEMRLAAGGVDQVLSAEASEQGLPNTEASVATSADWLARLADQSGNLTVTVGGGDPIVIPMGEPLASLIRNCAR